MHVLAGADIASGPVWIEYITFLKSLPCEIMLQALNAQEESQRMTAVRKVYQKAIVTPTHHVEQLWKDYENFENSVSRQLAKGLLSEYQPKYNSARAVYRERKKYVDEIDWNMLAVPPTGSYKEELQWMAWKRLLAFEKGNPQRIDSVSSNKRIVFTYEQCLMYLYHYPDIWYDYATWHAKSGSIDAAIKVFQRALKALPDSEMLKYAYAELEESRGAILPAKKIYESLLGDGVNTTALAHIQFIRFLRRNEGVEAARKYFLDARKSPNCTYHVYVAYALMAFCLDKDPKTAHKVFEAGLKRFMHEPVYILEYADFLSRLNDDRNIRALFERALSSLPPEESVETLDLPFLVLTHLGAFPPLTAGTRTVADRSPSFDAEKARTAITNAFNCKIEFFPDYCVIQDLHTGKRIGNGMLHDGLYMLEGDPGSSIS
uniref:Suppressor of forked domain-containing protein n=1 Tax=Manihot esculenta TaxID=3983 RepID=A0A2C9ULU6_MANES